MDWFPASSSFEIIFIFGFPKIEKKSIESLESNKNTNKADRPTTKEREPNLCIIFSSNLFTVKVEKRCKPVQPPPHRTETQCRWAQQTHQLEVCQRSRSHQNHGGWANFTLYSGIWWCLILPHPSMQQQDQLLRLPNLKVRDTLLLLNKLTISKPRGQNFFEEAQAFISGKLYEGTVQNLLVCHF